MTLASALSGVLPEESVAPADEGRWAGLGGVPEAVVSPASEQEVAAVLAWASREGVGVVPAGSGRRFMPHRVTPPFVVLTSNALRGLEIYEPADLTFTARAGTTVADLATELRANRQWMPFDPPAIDERTLGGLVSMGESGPLATGYGGIRNHVLGATLVTGDGRIIRLGGRVVKNVAGFDLLKLAVGGRGRVGFLTSVCMRAFPVPAAERTLLLESVSLDELVPLALAVGTAPVLPVSCVLEAREPRAGAQPRGAETGAASRLVVSLHGTDATVEADRRALEAHLGRAFSEVGLGPSHVSPSASEGAHGETVLVASFLPSRTPEAVDLLSGTAVVAVAIDTYAARMRVTLAEATDDAIRGFVRGIEGLGGAVAVARAPLSDAVDGLGSKPTESERAIEHRIRQVFDPQGVLWRSAR